MELQARLAFLELYNFGASERVFTSAGSTGHAFTRLLFPEKASFHFLLERRSEGLSRRRFIIYSKASQAVVHRSIFNNTM